MKSNSQQRPPSDKRLVTALSDGAAPAMDTQLIEVFTAPGCTRCAGIMAMVGRVVEDFDLDISLRLVNVLEEIDYAVELGILMTPAIVINGNLVFSAPPSEKKFRTMLARHLGRNR